MAKTIQKKKPIITDQSFTFLKNYINNASPVGFETWGQKLWLEYLKPYADTSYVDPYGTAVGVITPDHKLKEVVRGPADEVSWVVDYVTPQRLLYLKSKGAG